MVFVETDATHMRLIDISGQRFGRLLVLGRSDRKSNGGSMWLCRCDCGTEKAVNSSNLRPGRIVSCGCAAHEWATAMGSNPAFIAKRAAKMTQHGHKRRAGKSPEYAVWLGMKRRCYKPKSKDFARWGGRGIRVCDRWNQSFEAFLEDMGPRPAGMSIDRLDPDKDYEPGNCRWATATEQGSENKRDLIPITVGGVDYPSTSAACRAHGLPLTRVKFRLDSGMTIEDAFDPTDARARSRRTKESYLRRDRR